MNTVYFCPWNDVEIARPVVGGQHDPLQCRCNPWRKSLCYYYAHGYTRAKNI